MGDEFGAEACRKQRAQWPPPRSVRSGEWPVHTGIACGHRPAKRQPSRERSLPVSRAVGRLSIPWSRRARSGAEAINSRV